MEKVLIVVGSIVVALGFGLLMGFPVMWLWNWLMPVLFGLIKISFWQAVGLTWLCHFLFKGSSSNSK
jgi:hypothetical protein